MDETADAAPRSPGDRVWRERAYRAALAAAVGLCLSGFLLGMARSVCLDRGLPGLTQEPLGEVRGLAQAGRAQQAAREYRHAVGLNGDIDILLYAGRGLAEAGDLAGAEATLLQARRLRPDRAEPYTELGWAWLRARRHHEAASAFQQALRLDPAQTRALVGLGETWLETDNLQGARSAFEAALRRDPRSEQAHGSLGIVLAIQGDPAAAVPHFESALGLRPAAATLANLARARAAAGLKAR
jgi:tetratricopeptide (TPR) repeat protein